MLACLLQEMALRILVHIGVVEYGVEIPLYHTDGSAELVVDIIGKLALASGLFLYGVQGH